MARKQSRMVSDGMGSVSVPAGALYGAQTQRAVSNFNLSNLTLPRSFISSLAEIKKAAALANHSLDLINDEVCEAIVQACDEIARGDHPQQFPVDVFQTGSGTSSNMNINEVISGLCERNCGLQVHPNDHVNMGQSSNDVIPTAIQLSSLVQLKTQLFPAFSELICTIDGRAQSLKYAVKTGRTHLMDALPLSFGQELSGWSAQLRNAIEQLEDFSQSLSDLAQGGTAIGTGANTHRLFAKRFSAILSENLADLLEEEFSPAENFFSAISSQDSSVGLSGHLRVLATSLNKISTDLRWMNSGPGTGLAEIELEALQPGSSIMPGKVNPVIPEAVSMACAQVVGNDATIAMAGMSSNFQLNTMLPVIAYNLLQSIDLLTNSANHLSLLCIRSFSINSENINAELARNPILATALAPHIGYDAAAKIAKKAFKSKRAILQVALHETDLDEARLRELLDPLQMANIDR